MFGESKTVRHCPGTPMDDDIDAVLANGGAGRHCLLANDSAQHQQSLRTLNCTP